jgi:hypothetical protein
MGSSKINSLKLGLFFRNVLYLFRYALNNELIIKLEVQQHKILNKIQLKLFFKKILNYHNNNPSQEYEKELMYLKELGYIKVYPYRKIRTLDEVRSGFDDEKQMPYVIHKINKKLYFPKNWSEEKAKAEYIHYMEVENLLGGEFTEKMPHQYQTQDFCVKDGDIVLDIGSAEALFALDIVDLAKKVYIFESDRIWIDPLMATFEPYNDKVVIVNKRVSDKDGNGEIKLETCLNHENLENLFIKMDIEGSERKIINDNIWLFSKNINLRVACATYHKQGDANDFNTLFQDLGYETEFSEGFLLFIFDEIQQPPYFRKGILRARKMVI